MKETKKNGNVKQNTRPIKCRHCGLEIMENNKPGFGQTGPISCPTKGCPGYYSNKTSTGSRGFGSA